MFTDLTQLERLQAIAELVPSSFYWMDTDHTVLGCNESAVKSIGATSICELVGKTPADIHADEHAAPILTHNLAVMLTKKASSQEEVIRDFKTGKLRYFNVSKSPLRNENDDVFGIACVAIEITAEKQAELDRLEKLQSQAAHDEQEKSRKIADQFVHDIRSPLASMLMILRASEAIPEYEHNALHLAATKIGSITSKLLGHYSKKSQKGYETAFVDEAREQILISSAILQLLNEKKCEYQNSAVKIEHQFTKNANFAWVRVRPTEFKHALSNLINNAVESFDGKSGQVKVALDADDSTVSISISDTGKGIAPEQIEKIKSQVTLPPDKRGTHGIGLAQVYDMLKDNAGNMNIDSHINAGTGVVMTFPRVPTKKWIADDITLNDNDTVVIVDNDNSIHVAWDSRFDKLIGAYPNLNIQHFELGQETIDYINGLTPKEKSKVFLLTDYELGGQNLNGLDVVTRTAVERSILVTSHHANQDVRNAAQKVGTLILPKQLANDIPIYVNGESDRQSTTAQSSTKVDAVFLDDDQILLASYKFTYGHKKTIDLFHDPRTFLMSLAKYPKDTKILLDYQLDNYHLNGIQIGAQLHSQGFSQLYLITGMSFTKSDLPDYLTLVAKSDLGQLQSIIGELHG